MRLRPLNEKIVVKRFKEPETTKGGIVIPDNFSERAEHGKILAVGPGKRDKYGELVKIRARAGDHILFHQHAGQTVEVDKEEYVILTENDILGIIKQ